MAKSSSAFKAIASRLARGSARGRTLRAIKARLAGLVDAAGPGPNSSPFASAATGGAAAPAPDLGRGGEEEFHAASMFVWHCSKISW